MVHRGVMRNETAPIVVAVDDALLHPEAMHLAAVTGRLVIDVRDPAETARHIARGFAVLIDDTFLAALAPSSEADALAHPGMFRICGNADAEAEAGTGKASEGSGLVRDSFMLPAEAASLLKAHRTGMVARLFRDLVWCAPSSAQQEEQGRQLWLGRWRAH